MLRITTIQAEINLSGALSIELDRIEGNKAILYVVFNSATKEYTISLAQLAELAESASFKWLGV